MPGKRPSAMAKMRSGETVAIGAAGWLSLAATPVFAVMALLNALSGDGRPADLCSQAGLPSLLTGMGPMYLLMATFHLHPWLRFMSNAKSDQTWRDC